MLGDNYALSTRSGGAKQLLAVVALVSALMLLIVVVAGLGVLNTVALQIRERAHDIGVFKALGMTPRQTLTMIAYSVAIAGLIAGIVAVPAGVVLHHNVIPAMTHGANSGYPPSLISVYSVPEMIGLALAGLLIAVAGALAPPPGPPGPAPPPRSARNKGDRPNGFVLRPVPPMARSGCGTGRTAAGQRPADQPR